MFVYIYVPTNAFIVLVFVFTPTASSPVRRVHLPRHVVVAQISRKHHHHQ